MIHNQHEVISDLQVQLHLQDSRAEVVERCDHMGVMLIDEVKVNNDISLTDNVIQVVEKYTGIKLNHDDVFAILLCF